MFGSEEDLVKRINQIFGEPLIDLKLLERYKQQVGKQLTSEIPILYTKKQKNKVSQRIEKTNQLINRIARFSGKDAQNLRETLTSSRKTDITKKLSRILIPSNKNRKQFQKLRQKTIEDMRQNIDIKKSHVQMFQLFYHIFSPQKTIQLEILKPKQEQLLQRQQDQLLSIDHNDRKLLKKVLTSIKKLTGIQSRLQQCSEKSKHAYQLSKDMKTVMQKVCETIKQEKVLQKLQELLQAYKSSNQWFGPRFWKFVENRNWSCNQITVLIQNLKTTKIIQRDVVSRVSQVNHRKKKVIQNLQKYLQKMQNQGLDKQQMKNQKGVTFGYIQSEYSDSRLNQSGSLEQQQVSFILSDNSSGQDNSKKMCIKKAMDRIKKQEIKRDPNEIYNRDHQLFQMMLDHSKENQVFDKQGSHQNQKQFVQQGSAPKNKRPSKNEKQRNLRSKEKKNGNQVENQKDEDSLYS